MNKTDSPGAVSLGNRRLRHRLVQTALVLGLLIISSVTVTSLSPGGPLFGAVGNPPATTIPPPSQTEGQLKVTINDNPNASNHTIIVSGNHTVSGSANYTVSPSVSRVSLCIAGPIWNSTIVLVPIGIACAPSVLPRNVTFVVVQQGTRFPERHTIVVDVPGATTINVGVGNYSITTVNRYFNMTAFASVANTGSTNIVVQLRNNFFVPRLTEAYDIDLSGTVGPWDPVEMLLQNTNSTLYLGEPVYIQTIYYPVGYACSSCKLNPLLPYETSLATVTQITKSPGGYWAALAPRSIIGLQDINNAWLVTVSSSYTVVQGA